MATSLPLAVINDSGEPEAGQQAEGIRYDPDG
jgi:hypothetical protein